MGEQVNVPKFGAHEARALPQMAWQVSAVPAQLLGLHGQRGAEGRGLPFLAAVTGTAVLGVVDWPVALLIAGGYLLSSRPPGQSPPAGSLPAPAPALHDAAAERRTPAAPPLADAKPAAAEPAPVPASAAEPGLSSATSGAGRPAAPPRQLDQPAPVSIDQASSPVGTPAAAARPDQPPAPVAARQPRQSRPARDTRRASSPAAAAREPWPGYDQMTVPRVLARLDDPDVDLAALERYEMAHRDRKMVRAAVSSRRASRPT